ncbi:MAG TPA: kelch repeat-containing protein [Polyangiaceae bacterium]
MLRALDLPPFARLPRDAVTSTRRTSAQASLALLLLLAGCGSRTGLEGPLSDTLSDAGPPKDDAARPTPQSILLFGGLGATPDGGYADRNDTWLWTATSGWTEAHPPQSPSPRFGAMAASLGGDVVLFGGSQRAAETWAWNGATWAQRQPSWSPPPLVDSVFSVLGQGLVLFGGYDSGTVYHDVWQWDGTTWTHGNPAVVPPARQAPAGAVLDGSLVIFGGEDTDFLPLGDTWVYDGTSWTQKQPAHSPSPRRGAVAAARDGRVVLFGGDTLPPSYGLWRSVDETWVWDGTDWTQAHPAQSPEARSFAGMAAAGGQVVLFGGSTFGGSFGEPSGTWTWDGTTWTRFTGPGPEPRNYPTMAAR